MFLPLVKQMSPVTPHQYNTSLWSWRKKVKQVMDGGRKKGERGCHYRELMEGLRVVCWDQGRKDQGKKKKSVGRE